MDNLYNFKNPERLVRMSPFLVASYIGKSDALHLEAEKLVDLFDFEEFSLQAKELTASSEIFLNLENEDYDYIWQLSLEDLLSIIRNLPDAAIKVLGKDASILVLMLEKVVMQVAKADGYIHDLEIAGAEDLGKTFEDIVNKLSLEQSKEMDPLYGFQIIDGDKSMKAIAYTDEHDNEIENEIEEY